jgi:hypothetical protein
VTLWEALAWNGPVTAAIVIIAIGAYWLAYQALTVLRDHLRDDFWERYGDDDDTPET